MPPIQDSALLLMPVMYARLGVKSAAHVEAQVCAGRSAVEQGVQRNVIVDPISAFAFEGFRGFVFVASVNRAATRYTERSNKAECQPDGQFPQRASRFLRVSATRASPPPSTPIASHGLLLLPVAGSSTSSSGSGVVVVGAGSFTFTVRFSPTVKMTS